MTEIHARYKDTYHVTYLKITKWSGISLNVKIYIYMYMPCTYISIHIIFKLIGIRLKGSMFLLEIKYLSGKVGRTRAVAALNRFMAKYRIDRSIDVKIETVRQNDPYYILLYTLRNLHTRVT